MTPLCNLFMKRNSYSVDCQQDQKLLTTTGPGRAGSAFSHKHCDVSQTRSNEELGSTHVSCNNGTSDSKHNSSR